MAEQNEGQEKTEQPTPKRIDDARKKGQIARSRELSTMLVLLGGAITLWLSAAHVANGLGDIMRENFTLKHADIFEPALVVHRFMAHILDALAALAPLLLMATVIAIAAPLAVGGWILSGQALQPKFERVDPIKGLKRVFGPKGLMELAKALAKFVLILSLAVVALSVERDAILSLGRAEVGPSLAAAVDVLLFCFLVCCAATIVVALIDVPFQIWQHGRQLRMSRQDIKDENKETEGSPELKGRVRAMQQEVARRRMMEEVPKADVVVTNPEHYAVALRFDPETMRAPVLVAKGADEVARNIREVAAAHGVTVMSAPPLARAIFYTTKINREIPAGLYVAVARVLAYVFQLRDGAVRARPPEDLPIPPEMNY
ncbi:MAG: flagellar biosynthesis protein FlhB [Gammaproteobacteria bacterium]